MSEAYSNMFIAADEFQSEPEVIVPPASPKQPEPVRYIDRKNGHDQVK